MYCFHSSVLPEGQPRAPSLPTAVPGSSKSPVAGSLLCRVESSRCSSRLMKRIFHFRASSSQLGPLEQRLLEALWLRGNATVRDVVDENCPDLAYTTVMTTLDRLFKKNLLTREADGRAFRYTPRFSREELHREVAGEALQQ